MILRHTRATVSGDSVSPSRQVTEILVTVHQNKPDWMKDPSRACRGLPPEWFYGEDSHEMVKLCQECPVIVECLDYAVENHEYGTWGGTSERARAKIRQIRRKDERHRTS